jgi:hypothetical protein
MAPITRHCWSLTALFGWLRERLTARRPSAVGGLSKEDCRELRRWLDGVVRNLGNVTTEHGRWRS